MSSDVWIFKTKADFGLYAIGPNTVQPNNVGWADMSVSFPFDKDPVMHLV